MSLLKSRESSQNVSSLVNHVAVTTIMSISCSKSACKRVCSLFLSDLTFPVAILTELKNNVLLGVSGSICIRLLRFGPSCGIDGILDVSFCFFLLCYSPYCSHI